MLLWSAVHGAGANMKQKTYDPVGSDEVVEPKDIA